VITFTNKALSGMMIQVRVTMHRGKFGEQEKIIRSADARFFLELSALQTSQVHDNLMLFRQLNDTNQFVCNGFVCNGFGFTLHLSYE